MQTTLLEGVFAMDRGTPWALFDNLSEIQLTLTQNLVLSYFPARVYTRVRMPYRPDAPFTEPPMLPAAWLTRELAERLLAEGIPVRGFARVAVLRTTGLPR